VNEIETVGNHRKMSSVQDDDDGGDVIITKFCSSAFDMCRLVVFMIDD